MKDLKLIPFDELISKTELPDGGVRSLAESSSKAVHVKRKLRSLYQSLNTGGTSLPFNVMEVALIIDKLMERIGTNTSNGKIELTLLSDKGVKWLNEINSIVKEKSPRIVTTGIVEEMEIDDMLEDLMKHLDESEILYED
jgi:hypothetical protein